MQSVIELRPAPPLPPACHWGFLLMGSLLVCFTAISVPAETVYRSVDESGAVSYSSRPPQNAVDVMTISVAPSPTAAEREQALQRLQEIEAMTEAWAAEREANQAKRDEQSQLIDEYPIGSASHSTTGLTEAELKERREKAKQRRSEAKGKVGDGVVRIQPVAHRARGRRGG